ncbi:MAG TPA: TRAP transporter TatT component family protein [Labilithrix sp.]
MRTKLLGTALASMLALGSTGCIKKMLLNGQIEATRTGAGASDTIGDYELARSASQAALLQFEGMHRLAPDNLDALYLLTRGWGGYGYAFAEDDYLAATVAGDDALADYHKKRTRLAYDRAIAYGLELLGKTDEGFPAAKKNADTMAKWLKENFTSKDDAENLFWVGAAWMARVNLLKDEPEYVADLFVGVSMLERSRELDPEYLAWGATSTLGAYHARAGMAELDDAKKLLDQALEATKHQALGIQLVYATKYACSKGDQALYEKMINEVLESADPNPQLRLQNTIAKRRARRALSKSAMEECGFTAPSKAKQ